MSRNLVPAALALLAVLALSAQPALAKPTFVKGASCKACHLALPAKKDNLVPMAVKMLKMHKTTDCKTCHGAAAGKLTVIKKKK